MRRNVANDQGAKTQHIRYMLSFSNVEYLLYNKQKIQAIYFSTLNIAVH